MASSSSQIKQPDEDPYQVLGLEFPLTDDAAITKAYRKLALQLHPDKQKQTATAAEAEAMALQFHQLQQARAFLLDSEFQASRVAYDRKRASQQARVAHETAQREKLSEHRKRMQHELAQAEAQAATKKRKPAGKSSASSSSSSKQQRREELRRQGQAMREAHAAAAATKRQQSQQEATAAISTRQVRLKWSRKRVKQSPSEDIIAHEFGAKFGPVESVEMIGSKGNAALVTFRHASSCRPCVDFYQTSSEMRATFIQEPASTTVDESFSSSSKPAVAPNDTTTTTNNNSNARDYESVAEWQARRAAARAGLVQEQEQDENDEESAAPSAVKRSTKPFSTDFLPKFPTPKDPSLSYWDQLAGLEEQILTPILGHERFEKLMHLKVEEA